MLANWLNICSRQWGKSRCLLEDLAGYAQLPKSADLYVPWSTSAIRPKALVSILNSIALSDRPVIVELGSGVSTLYIAQLLHAKNEGRFYSVENDSDWLRFLAKELDKAGLGESVSFIHAPLRANPYALDNAPWYDVDVLNAQLGEDSIDILIVDGPPAYLKGNELARYPAVPVLKERFSDDFLVFLDDAQRRGEREILRLWESELDIKFQHRMIQGGYAFGSKKRLYNL